MVSQLGYCYSQFSMDNNNYVREICVFEHATNGGISIAVVLRNPES